MPEDTKYFVFCLECGKRFKMLIWQHLKFKHSMTMEGYLEKYPDAVLVPERRRLKGEKHPMYGVERTDMVGDRNPAKKPEVRKRIKKNRKGINSSNSFAIKEACSIRSEMLFGRTKETHEYLAQNSKLMTELWKNPEYRKKTCKSLKESYRSGRRIPNSPIRGQAHYETSNGRIWLRSTWEYNFALVMDYLGIRWEYEPKRFDLGDLGTYTPDFYLPDSNEYVELKGWIEEKFVLKWAELRKRYPNIKIKVMGEELYNKMISDYPEALKKSA